jgi:hypothetical protein
MVFGEGSHCIVAVVVIQLVSDVHSCNTSILGGFLKIFREKLSLLIEIVAGSLGTRLVLFLLACWSPFSCPLEWTPLLKGNLSYHINKNI